MSYNNHLPVVWQYFTNIAGTQNGYYWSKFESTKSLGVCYWWVKIPLCGCMEYGLKHIACYVQKYIAALAICYNWGLVRDQPLGRLHLWNCLLHALNIFLSICCHYNDVIMGSMASQITSLTVVYSTVYSGADQSKYQSSASLAFVCGEFTGDRWIPRTNGQ